jgi:hypothetical protein
MRDDARLYKRGRVWWGWVYDYDGNRIDFSTRCRDKDAARILCKQREAEAADPNYAASARASLGEALKLLIEDREQAAKAGRRADATVKMHREKAGVLTRILETSGADEYAPLRLARLGAADVDRFIAARREEWALPPRSAQLAEDGSVVVPAREGRHVKDATIAKELVTLRCALKLARRRGLWVGDPGAILPTGFSPAYKPKERRLSRDELHLLHPYRGSRGARRLHGCDFSGVGRIRTGSAVRHLGRSPVCPRPRYEATQSVADGPHRQSRPTNAAGVRTRACQGTEGRRSVPAMAEHPP